MNSLFFEDLAESIATALETSKVFQLDVEEGEKGFLKETLVYKISAWKIVQKIFSENFADQHGQAICLEAIDNHILSLVEQADDSGTDLDFNEILQLMEDFEGVDGDPQLEYEGHPFNKLRKECGYILQRTQDDLLLFDCISEWRLPKEQFSDIYQKVFYPYVEYIESLPKIDELRQSIQEERSWLELPDWDRTRCLHPYAHNLIFHALDLSKEEHQEWLTANATAFTASLIELEAWQGCLDRDVEKFILNDIKKSGDKFQDLEGVLSYILSEPLRQDSTEKSNPDALIEETFLEILGIDITPDAKAYLSSHRVPVLAFGREFPDFHKLCAHALDTSENIFPVRAPLNALEKYGNLNDYDPINSGKTLEACVEGLTTALGNDLDTFVAGANDYYFNMLRRQITKQDIANKRQEIIHFCEEHMRENASLEAGDYQHVQAIISCLRQVSEQDCWDVISTIPKEKSQTG